MSFRKVSRRTHYLNKKKTKKSSPIHLYTHRPTAPKANELLWVKLGEQQGPPRFPHTLEEAGATDPHTPALKRQAGLLQPQDQLLRFAAEMDITTRSVPWGQP